MKALSLEIATETKASVKDLRVQAALGKAASEDLLKDQQRELKRRLEILRSGVDLGAFSRSIGRLIYRLHDYQVKSDVFQKQLHLSKAETGLRFESCIKEAGVRLKELETKLKSGKRTLPKHGLSFLMR
ncbi:MAG: hypothetical protein ACJAYA_001409 [Bacteroidia bacterium]|jgi:hypothetical protein